MDATDRVRVSTAEQTEGLGLFAQTKPKPRRMADTSISAEAKEAAHREIHKVICRQAIREAKGDGITRQEISDRTGLKVNTVNARCREILDDTGEGVGIFGRRGAESVLMEVGYSGGRA
jgi:DNA-directed RNA polymerase specialized sigma24 family protein